MERVLFRTCGTVGLEEHVTGRWVDSTVISQSLPLLLPTLFPPCIINVNKVIV